MAYRDVNGVLVLTNDELKKLEPFDQELFNWLKDVRGRARIDDKEATKA